MKKPTIRTGSENKLLEYLVANKIPHIKKITNNTTVIQTANANWICSDNRMSFKDLAFMQKVKKSAIIPEKGYQIENLKFNYFNPVPSGVYKNVVEIDLNGAYWKAAYLLGIIPEEIYKEGLEKEKHLRLAALGSLATHKDVYRFDGEDYFLVPVSEEQRQIEVRNRSAFFECARYVSGAMFAAMDYAGRQAMFFWVDAIFADASLKTPLAEFFENNFCFETKVKEIKFVDIYETCQMRVFDFEMADGTAKQFKSRIK